MKNAWVSMGVVGYHVAIEGRNEGDYLHVDGLHNHAAVSRERATLFPSREKAMGRAAHFMSCFPGTDARLRRVTRRWRKVSP